MKLDHLDRVETQSALWQKLRKDFEYRIDSLRRENDANLDAVQTASKRGRIAQLKELLALGEPPEPTGEGTTDDAEAQ